jgi:hypothetical protein
MTWLLVLRGEGGEDAAHRDARVAGDLADGGALVALGVEQLARGVHHALAGGFLLGLARRERAGRRPRLVGVGGALGARA